MQHRTRSRSSNVSFYVPGFPPGVKWLIISNVAVFILYYYTKTQLWQPLWQKLVLVPFGVVPDLRIWQLGTYMFLHDGFGHILWNMLPLWMFGADLEQTWGTKRFVQFYFFCGIGAGICVVALNFMFGDPVSWTIGCSGAIFGILLAYAMMYPNRTILFAFLIPIQVKWFVLIIGLITFMSAFGGSTSSVSHYAHLGGLLFAYIYMKLPRRRQRLDLAGTLSQRYRRWKVQRAKKKFQVYLKKQGSDRDPRVH
jgi:membrane associated rhomboid family serine protease